MIAVKHPDLITRYPTGVAGSKRLDDRLGESGGVAHQGSGDTRFDAFEFIVESGGGYPNRLLIGLIGGMNRGMNPEYDFAHQLHQRGKQQMAGILLLGGVGKKLIE